MRRLVVGDIHGGYKALMQVLEKANFNPEEDLLISLGDIVDGWPQSKECIEFFYNLPNKVWVRGNHDQWFIDWLDGKGASPSWTGQGGEATLKSFGYEPSVAMHYANFCRATQMIYESSDGMVFIHGGFRPNWHPALEIPDVLMWDRNLIREAHDHAARGEPTKYRGYDKIFLGHTSIWYMGYQEPQIWGNVYAMDTGGGWEGKLSVMDVDTEEYWQSDIVADLYPEATGRIRR